MNNFRDCVKTTNIMTHDIYKCANSVIKTNPILDLCIREAVYANNSKLTFQDKVDLISTYFQSIGYFDHNLEEISDILLDKKLDENANINFISLASGYMDTTSLSKVIKEPINKEFFFIGDTHLSIAIQSKDYTMSKLLSTNPMLNKCNSHLIKLKLDGYNDLIENPTLINEIKYKSLNSPATNTVKIPHIAHGIWLNDANNFKDIPESDVLNLIKNKSILSPDWEYFIWINFDPLLSKSAQKLAEHGFKFMNFHDHKDFTSSTKINDAINNHKWGVASDILRYEIINKFGGVYADINFSFARNFDIDCSTYDFFIVEWSHPYLVDNYFFAAKPNHPIISKTINLIEHSYAHPPLYFTNEITHNARYEADYLTARPLSLSFYKYAHSDGNIDTSYPYEGSDAYDRSESLDLIFARVKEQITFQEALTDYENGNNMFSPNSKLNIAINSITTEHQRSYLGDLYAKFIEKALEETFCSDHQEFVTFQNALDSNGLCLANEFIVGRDNASSGGTWL